MVGRIDFKTALGAVSPGFVSSGRMGRAAGIVVFTTALDKPGVKDFVAAYQAKYGIAPTQRSFFAFESTLLVIDAIKRAGSDRPEEIQKALKTSSLPSALGGDYKLDDHNHPHTPMQILGVKDGKVVVIGEVGG